MDKPDVRVALVILKEDKILLVQHQKKGRKYWLLPGGRVDFGESLIEALERELLEEANIKVKVGNLLFISDAISPDNGKRHIINIFFEGKIIGGELKIGNEEILQQIEFIPVSQLDKLTFYPMVKEELKEWLQKRKPLGYLGNRWE
ncbi:MAG: NUDIX domain-containing protein [bacterium]